MEARSGANMVGKMLVPVLMATGATSVPLMAQEAEPAPDVPVRLVASLATLAPESELEIRDLIECLDYGLDNDLFDDRPDDTLLESGRSARIVPEILEIGTQLE